MSLDEFLESLTEFEAGGSRLAHAPTENSPVMIAQASNIGGATCAVDWFRNSLKSSSSSMLFLVGAPGNGKSYLLREVTRGLNPIGDHSRDRRRYDFSAQGSADLIVVNDASAPAQNGDSTGQLLADVKDAISNRKFLHANVNRGVLYQELRAQIDHDSIRELFEWLSDTSKEPKSNWKFLSIQPLEQHSNIRCGKLRVETTDGPVVVPIVIVLMDFYSIFECQPKHEIERTGDWESFPGLKSGEVYRIQLPRSDSRESKGHWLQTPAGQLLEELVGKANLLIGESFDPLDLICSNLRSLQSERVFCGVLSALRNTELITSQHISFREFWTAIATLIIGNSESRLSIDQAANFQAKPSDWMRKSIELCELAEQKEKIKLLIQISSIRFSQSLFGSTQSPFKNRVDISFSPLLSLTRSADPVIDARPSATLKNQNFGWVTPVIEALRAQIGDRSIIETLRENALQDGIQFEYSPFDKALDDEVLRLLSADYNNDPILSKSELESVLMWYGDYLSRLFAISIGVTAFENEVHDWVAVWNKAFSNQPLPPRISKALMNILLPKFRVSGNSDGDQRLVSYLTSRTESIMAKPNKPRLAIEITNSPIMRASALGDELTVEIKDETGAVLINFDLDFVFLREAISFLEWPQAFTDNSVSVTPKIERMRASMVNKRMYAGGVRLINGVNIEDVQVS